jgi:uncharacterized membrane protein
MDHTHANSQKNKPDFLSRHRIEALADGLFAIVMTLLVLELKVPDLEHNVSARVLAQAMASQWRMFFSFTATFILAAVFWLLHQRILRLTNVFDRTATFLSLAPMLFVSLLPFSTATVSRYINNATASILYFGNQFFIAFLIAMLWLRTKSAAMEPDEAREHRLVGIRVVTLTLAFLLASVVAAVQSQYSWSAFVVAVAVSRIYQRRILRV